MSIHPAGVLHVMSLAQARRHKRRYDAVISIEDPALVRRHFMRFHRNPHPDHLILKFEDFDDDSRGVMVAERNHVEDALEFGRRHQDASLMVHCFAGRSRSTAVAYAILADRLGPGFEDEALRQVRAVRPIAIPNLVVVDLADVVLGRSGALRTALDRIEAGDQERMRYRAEKMALLEKAPALFSMKKDFPSI